MDTSNDPLVQEPLALLARSFTEQLVQLSSGAQVAVRSSGVPSSTQPSVVLLHGISSGAASWLQTVQELGDVHVIAWDAPGYGASTALPAATPLDSDYADRLHALLRALGVSRAVLVGHSLGALMACAYVRSNYVRSNFEKADSPRIERVVLISPAGGYGAADKVAEGDRMREQRQTALQSLGVVGLAQRTAARLLSAQASPAATAWVRWNAERLVPQGYLQAVEMLRHSDLGQTKLDMPIEVHCGDADVVTPPAACQSWAKFFSAPFSLLSQAGHASPVEQPAAVARLITAALQTVKDDSQ